METRTYNVYKFNELNDEQKEKVVHNLRDINVDYDWSQWTIKDETIRLETLGYNNAEIFFSGFWSQGDGASFTATGDIEKLVPKKLRKFVDGITFSKSHQYEHEYTMSIHVEYNDEPTGRIQLVEFDNLEKELLEDARNEAREIYKRLQNEYEYLTSDKSIIETIEANEYDFTEDGHIA